MFASGQRPSPTGLWAYVYDIELPRSEDARRTIQALLDRERAESRGLRTWGGRVVVENGVTRILIVSDSPSQDRDVNRRLAAELIGRSAAFAITESVLIRAAGAA